MEAYNNTSSASDNIWSIPNILQLIGIVLVFVLNIHQSIHFQHFQSECCLNDGKGCCSFAVDGFWSETGKSKPNSENEIPI